MRKRFLFIRIIIMAVAVIFFTAFALLWFGKLDITVEGIAIVAPKHEEKMKADISGKVKEVLITEGDTVQAGQDIIKFYSNQLERNLQQARIDWEESQNNVAELKARLRLLSITNQLQIKNALSSLRAAEASLKALHEEPPSEILTTTQQDFFQANIMLKQAEKALADAKKSKDDEKIKEAQAQYNLSKSIYQVNRTQLEALRKGASTEELAEAEAKIERESLALQLAQMRAKESEISLNNQIKIAQEKLKLARAKYDEAKTALEKAYLKSPITGQVVEVNVKAGDSVLEASPLCTIVDTSEYVLLAQIPEREIQHVKINQPARIYLNALVNKRYEYLEGHVTTIAPAAISGRTGTFFQVTIAFSNNSVKEKLKKGLTGRVKLQGTRKRLLSFFLR